MPLATMHSAVFRIARGPSVYFLILFLLGAGATAQAVTNAKCPYDLLLTKEATVVEIRAEIQRIEEQAQKDLKDTALRNVPFGQNNVLEKSLRSLETAYAALDVALVKDLTGSSLEALEGRKGKLERNIEGYQYHAQRIASGKGTEDDGDPATTTRLLAESQAKLRDVETKLALAETTLRNEALGRISSMYQLFVSYLQGTPAEREARETLGLLRQEISACQGLVLRGGAAERELQQSFARVEQHRSRLDQLARSQDSQ